MNKITSLSLGLLAICFCRAQNISGVINNYAAVSRISGSALSVSSATAFNAGDHFLLVQMKGASVDTSNTSAFGDIIAMGGAGTYEFLSVASVSGNTLIASTAPTHTYNTDSGFVQVVSIPRYCSPVVAAPLTCTAWDKISGQGGIVAFEAGTLTISSSISASGKGFAGGAFASSNFGCDQGIYYGVQGNDGGQKGESISKEIPNRDGCKGKQANGGGGANSGNSGGGGGSNVGAGGLGGNQYSGCSTLDDRGIGGAGLSSALSTMFMGGGGGGGFEDNGHACSNGARGGGIIYIRANMIISNNGTITAAGGNVTVVSQDEGAGGGGGGGSIFLECPTISGSLIVKTDGGSGGSNNNLSFPQDCHGPGGGGGGGFFAYSGPLMPSGIVYSSTGGAAGMVNNPNSICFGTTNGATAGSTGTAVPNLPTSTLSLTVPNLTVSQSQLICQGESATLTAGGSSSYSWNTGATTTIIVVSPSITTSYTVTGAGTGSNTCLTAASTSVMVSGCVGFDHIDPSLALNMYPNPASDKLLFEAQKAVNIKIVDGTGRIVFNTTLEKGTRSIDITRLPAGIYFVKAIDQQGESVRKLVKID